MANDVYYLDCIEIKSPKNGACSIFNSDIDGMKCISLTDAGYQSTFSDVSEHIDKYYGRNVVFDHVIATHNDSDHCCGLINLLETYAVRNLWMLRPWEYAGEIFHRYPRYSSVGNLEKRLREVYSNLADLEDIAVSKGIPIHEPFQGASIGRSLVVAPTKERFLELVVSSDKTPLAASSAMDSRLIGDIAVALESTVNFVRCLWGEEKFPSQGTTAENEMSVVQYIRCPKSSFMLTGDAGRDGLTEALNYLESQFGHVPKIDYFEIPHHGSRRNLSSDLLDRMFGKKQAERVESRPRFKAIVHSCRMDDSHPRKVVTRAIHHRGGVIYAVNKGWLRGGQNLPIRENCATAKCLPYPDDQED